MIKKSYSISISKPGQGTMNEDAALNGDNIIAVSDGAGGGGIYADMWSAYMLDNLPHSPITTFAELDEWIEEIWETFYNDCEKKAKAAGGMVLNKFYDEGSFATLAAAWQEGNRCRWMSYGDSVIFHYNKATDRLEHSFTRLADFNRPPYLINYKDKLNEKGFHCGEFITDNDSAVMCATDALSHYVLMMYEQSHCTIYHSELEEAKAAATKNSILISAAENIKIDFYQDVIRKLINCKSHKINFTRHIEALLKRKLITMDDFSYALMLCIK